MNKVAIIMSTYNGEKFLKEQLDSLLGQKGISLDIFVRDDASKDNTKEILTEYREKYSNVHFINEDNIFNLGCKNSFLACLKYAYELNQFDYYAFCDQDDVWLENKVFEAVKKLNETKGKYKLYYSNKTFVDVELKTISEEHIKFYNDFIEALSSSLASGCTMVFNHELAGLSLKYTLEESDFHDSIVYRMAKFVGADIICDSKSYILYRQHGNNVCGQDTCKPYEKDLNKNIQLMKKNGDSWRVKSIREISEYLKDDMTEEAKYYSQLILTYKKKISSRFKLVFNKKVLKRGISFYMNWSCKVVLRKL